MKETALFVALCAISVASMKNSNFSSPSADISWAQEKNLHCYTGGGATVIGPPQIMPAGYCQLVCEGMPDCSGIMVSHAPAVANVYCYLLKDIDLGKCHKDPSYDTRIKHISKPCPVPPPAATPFGPGAGAWNAVQPACVGLSQASLEDANMFIRDNVAGRQCLLLVKDGKIAYEWYGHDIDPAYESHGHCQVTPAQRFVAARMCSSESGQHGWSYDARTNTVKVSGSCLDATIAKDLQVRDCTGSSAQRFIFDLRTKSLQASDGRCVDLKGYTTGQVQLLACNGLKNQQFEFNNSGTVCASCHDSNKRCLEITSRDPSDPSDNACTVDHTFGCAGSNSMWVSGKCKGQFKCNGRDIECFSDTPSSSAKKVCMCDPENKAYEGYSMTKSIGGFILFLAATKDGLNLDADIMTYGIKSPKAYPVTTRMMMAQVLGGDHRPGEIWRYDEMGDMWMHLLPQIVLAATNHTASYYMDILQNELGLSKHFTWPAVNTKWFRGAAGTCRDWARFGQLMLNRGYWGGKHLIERTYFEQMQQPVKYKPYNEYSNPCYGLLVWLNANKSKHPGCCWEASRLPNPKCNEDTFMPGAVTDLALIIGLYGRLLMTLPSANALVVGMGTDLRPIEPARIGYYPGLCKALSLPCNTPPPVPKTKCGEKLECTGMAAQCFAGGAWNHSEPQPGKEECMRCFQNRLPMYEKKFPESRGMIKAWCPQGVATSMAFLKCFCDTNSNPFAPWPTTTTTTMPPSPCPPEPLGPTPAPPPLPPPCFFGPDCVAALQAYKCKRYGGQTCYSYLRNYRAQLMGAGCPDFKEQSVWDKAFCWCGRASTQVGGNYTHAALEIVV